MSLSSNINTLPISCLLFNILLCSFLWLILSLILSLSQTNGARNVGVSNLSDEATQFQTIRLALCDSQTRQNVADIRSSPEECASLMGARAAPFQLTSESGNKKHRGSFLQPRSGSV